MSVWDDLVNMISQARQPMSGPLDQTGQQVSQGLANVGTEITSAAAPLAPYGTNYLKGQDIPNNPSGAKFTGNTPEDLANVVTSSLPAFGLSGEGLPSLSETGLGIKTTGSDLKQAAAQAIDETRAGVAANGGTEAGFLGFGKSAPKPDPMAWIDNIEAPNARKSPSAYSKGTDEVQTAYRENNIQNPHQVYFTQQDLFDKDINPALEKSDVRLPFGDSSKGIPGIIPDIITETKRFLPNLTDQQAENAASASLNRLYGAAQRETAPIDSNAPINPESVVPSDVSLKSAFKEKKDLNGSSAVDNFFNGINPSTPEDAATVAARNVLQDYLEKNAPDGITQKVKDYGLLDQGFPSGLKAYNESMKPPPPPPSNPFMEHAGKYITGAALGTGIIGAGIGTLALLNRQSGQKNPDSSDYTGVHQYNSNDTSYLDHTSTTVPQNESNYKQATDGSGNLLMTDPMNFKAADGKTPLLIQPTEGTAEVNKLSDQITQLNTDNANQAQLLKKAAGDWYSTQQIQAQITSNNSQIAAAQSAQAKYNNAITFSNKILDQETPTLATHNAIVYTRSLLSDPAIKQDLTTLINVPGFSIDKLKSAQNGKYAALAQAMQDTNISTAALVSAATKNSLNAVLDTMARTNLNKWNSFLKVQGFPTTDTKNSGGITAPIVGQAPNIYTAPVTNTGLPNNPPPPTNLAPTPGTIPYHPTGLPTFAGQSFEGGAP